MSRKSRKNSKSKIQLFDYNSLEQRNLLAVDLGVNVTGATYQTDSSAYPANATSDVGPDHIVEVMSGRINIYNKDTATPIRSTTVDNFFLESGGFVPDATENPNVLYDQLSERWFVVASGDKDQGNWIHLAMSTSSDAGGVWTTLQFVGDSQARSKTADVTLAVDADAIYMTTNNFGPIVGQSVSIFSIPKVDLVAPSPTLTNMSRFEGLDHETYGQTIQVASNFEASDGRARALGTLKGPSGETLMVQTDIVGAGDPSSSASLEGPWVIGDEVLLEFVFPFITEAPQVRQPFRAGSSDMTGNEWPISHSNWELNGAIIEADGGLWASHTFSYTNPLLGLNTPSSGIRWWEVDPDLHQVRLTDGDYGGYNYGVIADNNDQDGNNTGDRDYFNPTFRVNEYGVAVLGYNGSGFVEEGDTNRNLLPSNYVSVGITTNGADARSTQFEQPFETHAGLENYQIEWPSPWAEYASVRFDPEFKNTFLNTRQFANTIDRWSTQVVEVKPVDLIPVIRADNNNNVIVIRKSADFPELMEFEIDGVVTDQLPYEVLDRVRIQGYGGADRFIIDYTNGDPLAEAQLILDGGSGPDVVQSNNPGANEWVVVPTEFDLFTLTDTAYGDGTLNGTTDFVNVEELWGGDGPDHFLVTELVPPPEPEEGYPGVVGYLDGSLLGRGGDDIFEFAHNGAIGDSVNGGTGYNTLKFTDRAVNTDMELIGFGADAGFNGRSLGPVGSGPIGGDQTTDQFRDISQVIGADVNYYVNGNRIYDTLDMLPDVASTWTINDELSQYEANGVTMDFWQVDELSASNLDDTFNALANTMNPLVLNGLDGDDTYNFSSDAPTNTGTTANLQGLIVANAGTGANVMNVSNESGTAVNALIIAGNISGIGEISYSTEGDGTYDINVWGSGEDDLFRLHSFLQDNTLNVYSLAGDDEFDIQDLSTAMVNAYGGLGDDVYTIQRIQGVDHRNLVITDSVDAESDRVQLAGTILDETFDITDATFEEDLGDLNYTGIEYFGIDGKGGNDVINVKSSPYSLYVDGGDGDDIINVSSDAGDVEGELNGNLLGMAGALIIDGGSGNNRLNISYESGAARNAIITSDRITGLLPGAIEYRSTGGNFYGDTLSEGIQIEGSRLGNDKFNVKGLDIEHRMRIQAYEGIDRFTVRSGVFGDILVDGGEDRDFYSTFFNGQTNRQVIIRDRSTETNRLDAYGTEQADNVVITPEGLSRGDELVFFNTDLHFVGFSGLGGDDLVTVNNSAAVTTYVYGAGGDDVVNVENTDNINGMRVIGHDDHDTVNLNTVNANTHIVTLGGNGDDTVNISTDALGNVYNNGQEGSDTYNFSMSPTESRFLLAYDSGVAGVDQLNAIGTDADDSIEVRSRRVLLNSDTMAFNGNVEIVSAMGVGGEDHIEMFASIAPETRMEGGDDDDTLVVTSTALADAISTHGGNGDDTTITQYVKNTTTLRQYGDGGDDLFVFGSTMEANNGNLGSLRGEIIVSGGENSDALGEDMIYMNDAGLNIRYSYFSNNSKISPLPGPANLPRPEFAGVSFDETVEFVQLDGTQAANYFTVHSNEFTRFLFNGNDPHRTETGDFIQLVAESGDGHVLTWSNIPDGDGYWTFGNGNKDIVFESMEGVYNPPQFIIFNGGGQGDDDNSNPGGPQFMRLPGTTDDLMELDTLPSILSVFEMDRDDSSDPIFDDIDTTEASELDRFFELV